MALLAGPASVVAHLTLLAHPDAQRLRALIPSSQLDVDLLGVDFALLTGFAERASRAAATDQTLRDYVGELIDLGNAQNALLTSAAPREADPANLFVAGGRWLSPEAYSAVAVARSPQQALTTLRAALASSPLRPSLPSVAQDVARLDRWHLASALSRLTLLARKEPLSTAPVLLVLLRIEAQSRDLRTLAWGASLGTPVVLRTQELVTPT
jgi:vacuolar-type H+-ATPase subunit C/Vma6